MLWEYGSFPGCSIESRLIGAIMAEQKGEGIKRIRNDRFIAIPEASNIYAGIENIKDLSKNVLTELQLFFMNYANIEKKDLHLLGILDHKKAFALLRSSMVG